MTDLKRTPLFEQHIKLNAKMVPFAGWEMPVQYSSVKEESLKTRQDLGIFDVSHMGEFWVEGPQAEDFVDYLLTNEIKQAPQGKAIYSPLCNQEGKIIDDLIAYKINAQKILLCVNASNIDKDWNWISQNLGSYDCKLNNHSEQTCLIAIQGPRSAQFVEGLVDLTEKDMPYYSVALATYDNAEIILARTGYTGEDGFEIFCNQEQANSIWEKALDADATPCGLAARDLLRLEVCYPLYGHELTEDVTPLDTGLKWTVKLAKDNFIGKQALTDYQPLYQLVKLQLDKGIPREGYPVVNQNNQEVGKITSGSLSTVTGKGIALARIEKNKINKETEFTILIRNKPYQATKFSKPFVSGGHK